MPQRQLMHHLVQFMVLMTLVNGTSLKIKSKLLENTFKLQQVQTRKTPCTNKKKGFVINKQKQLLNAMENNVNTTQRARKTQNKMLTVHLIPFSHQNVLATKNLDSLYDG